MPLYRTKPVVKEAIRVEKDTVIKAEQTLHKHDLLCEAGDWIVRGLAGELYPCKDDLFRRLHVPVNGEAAKHFVKVTPKYEGQSTLPHPNINWKPLPGTELDPAAVDALRLADELNHVFTEYVFCNAVDPMNLIPDEPVASSLHATRKGE